MFHLVGLKGLVMYLIAPPGGIFLSLIVGDRCPVHPRQKWELHLLTVQDILSKDNIRNVSLKFWPLGIDEVVSSMPNMCLSLPWVLFRVISLQIRWGVFKLGTRTFFSLPMGSNCRFTTLYLDVMFHIIQATSCVSFWLTKL